MQTDKTKIMLYIDKDIKAQIQAAAASDHRSMNNYIIELIRKDIEEKEKSRPAAL